MMPSDRVTSVVTSDAERQVIAIVSDFVSELHLGQPLDKIGPASLLERDLGIYSLERLELLLRLEKACRVQLPEGAAMDADCVAGLICLVGGRSAPPLHPPVVDAGETFSNSADVPPGSVAFTIYVGLLLVLIGAAVWPLLHILPRGVRAATLLGRAARTLLRATGCPLEVTGAHHLSGACPAVLVANHESYVDSIVLLAALPIVPNILVNERLPGAPLVRTGVRAARYLSVDRRSMRSRLACADALVGALCAGESLLVFPEATFPPGPGLLPFRLGAFSAAAAAGRPVIPITLRGTRQMLPTDAKLLRRSPISVTIHPPIYPCDKGWKEALRLREQARRQIMQGAQPR